ncbi:MAG: DnaA ATPase domain-containing protein, partial [Roseateles sp.]
MSADLWQRGCERLAAELPEQQFNTWIRPLPPADVADGGADGVLVSLRVPNRFKLDWIRNQYAGRIESILSELAGRPARLELALAPREPLGRMVQPANQPVALGQVLHKGMNPASAPAAPSSAAQAQASVAAPAAVAAQPTPKLAAQTPPPSASRHRINPALTFDTLVPGRANQMARTAALHVAGAPGAMYNPLFIYGGVGLGKTHLIHAVGNALLKDKPDARVLYLHAEQFISDVVKNYQRKTFDELKAKY